MVDAYLLTILIHLRTPKDDPSTLGGKATSITYEVYHDLRDEEGIQTQYFHMPSRSHILENEIPEHSVPDYEQLHEVYQRPYFVRRIEDLLVIKAWESLTKDNYSTLNGADRQFRDAC